MKKPPYVTIISLMALLFLFSFLGAQENSGTECECDCEQLMEDLEETQEHLDGINEKIDFCHDEVEAGQAVLDDPMATNEAKDAALVRIVKAENWRNGGADLPTLPPPLLADDRPVHLETYQDYFTNQIEELTEQIENCECTCHS